jgi:hypothetical protein
MQWHPIRRGPDHVVAAVGVHVSRPGYGVGEQGVRLVGLQLRVGGLREQRVDREEIDRGGGVDPDGVTSSSVPRRTRRGEELSDDLTVKSVQDDRDGTIALACLMSGVIQIKHDARR